MLYEAIRLGSEIYRCDLGLSRDNDAYDDFMKEGIVRWKWRQPSSLDEKEVQKARAFVNGPLRARMQASASHILCALQKILPDLNKLQGKTILDVDLDERIDEECANHLVERCFDELAYCGPRNEATGASKIMHIVNPNLFVMWDSAIRGGYGESEYAQTRYANFLRRTQRLAKYAIEQVMEKEGLSHDSAIDSLKCHGRSHSLAKILDEYNFVKFTRNSDCVWKKEYEP